LAAYQVAPDSMTALEHIIRTQIKADGPMPLDRYMLTCLGHPEHGYYMTRDPFGSNGDFITAPEISQVFGELLGIWVATVWEKMGSPRSFALVELGPGRGTLMADMLRVLSKVPACAKAAEVHLVETSPILRDAQRSRVPQATWHQHVASLPAKPTIIVANEFFDALPIRQFVRDHVGTHEVVVDLDGDTLVLRQMRTPYQIPVPGQGVFEESAVSTAIATELGDHITKLGGAALIIDYGHYRTALGETLQAMRAHRYAPVLERPGEVDLTAHVDFEALARAFAAGGAKISGLMTQGAFLQAMGLEARLVSLTSRLQPSEIRDIESSSRRLAQSDMMGELFKVLCVTSSELEQPYPFGVE
jgi:NADH dehydrogenase [ubiquinone] 1 alpha subcomplex assembly factor 7